jgi:hypothetical protein
MVHSGVAYGYEHDDSPNPELPGQAWNWFHWYRDMFSGQVPDHVFSAYPVGTVVPGYVGVGPEAWLATTVRGYSLTARPDAK